MNFLVQVTARVTASDVKIEYLLQVFKASIVHIRGDQREITQGRCFKLSSICFVVGHCVAARISDLTLLDSTPTPMSWSLLSVNRAYFFPTVWQVGAVSFFWI